MSGLFRRLSSRRSAGPEANEPHTAAEPGTTDAPAQTPSEESGHRSLLTDPAAEYGPQGDPATDATRILPGDPLTAHEQRPAATSGDPLTAPQGQAAAAHAPAGDPLAGPQRQPIAPQAAAVDLRNEPAAPHAAAGDLRNEPAAPHAAAGD